MTPPNPGRFDEPQPRTINVVIVDDHAVVREGIAKVIDGAPDMTVAFVAGCGAELLDALGSVAAHVCVLDLSLPDMSGLELLARLRQVAPDLPVLVFTMHGEEAFGMASMKAGAAGFLTKGAAPSELLRAIRTVASGLVSVTPELASLMLRRDPTSDLPHLALSPREWEVFLRLVRGLRNVDISRELNLDGRTVTSYRRRILDKLGATSDAELVRYALQHGLEATALGPTPT